MRFGFLAFDIGRTKMYVHFQLMLMIESGGRRRRLGLQLPTTGDRTNQIRHYLGSTTIVSKTDLRILPPPSQHLN